MIGWCDDGSTGRSEVGVGGGPTLVSSSPPPPTATTLQPCPAMWSAEIRGNQWIKAKSVSLTNTLKDPEMGKRWGCIIMLLKPPVASSWTEVGYQDDLLLSNGYNLPPAGQLMFVNASLSHPAGYPWSSRSPNDLREGTSCPEWVPQMRSVIFDPASWPPTDGGHEQEWSDVPRLDLDLQPSVIGEGWSRIPTPLHPALPTLPPPTQRPSPMEESLLRWVHRWFINSFFFKESFCPNIISRLLMFINFSLLLCSWWVWRSLMIILLFVNWRCILSMGTFIVCKKRDICNEESIWDYAGI